MKHKHYDCIVAWAEGKNIQFKAFSHSEWEDVDMHGEEWYEHYTYRIKPEPQVCCGDYEKCWKACTPRGRWLAEKELRKEWVGLTNEEVLDILACNRGELVAIQKAQKLLKDKNTT